MGWSCCPAATPRRPGSTRSCCRWLISKHPNLRVGLISNTAKQANAFSRAVRFTLEANEYQHDIFGNLTGRHKWNDVEWIRSDSALLGTNNVTCTRRARVARSSVSASI